MLATFSEVEFQKFEVQEKKGSRCLVLTSSTKHELKLSRALTGKICTKKSDAHCCFANPNLMLFFVVPVAVAAVVAWANYLVNCNLPSHCYSPPSSFYLRISFLLLPYLIYFITKYQQKELKCWLVILSFNLCLCISMWKKIITPFLGSTSLVTDDWLAKSLV